MTMKAKQATVSLLDDENSHYSNLGQETRLRDSSLSHALLSTADYM